MASDCIIFTPLQLLQPSIYLTPFLAPYHLRACMWVERSVVRSTAPHRTPVKSMVAVNSQHSRIQIVLVTDGRHLLFMLTVSPPTRPIYTLTLRHNMTRQCCSVLAAGHNIGPLYTVTAISALT